MSERNEIKPAMSPEEWALSWQSWENAGIEAVGRIDGTTQPFNTWRVHAQEALAAKSREAA